MTGQTFKNPTWWGPLSPWGRRREASQGPGQVNEGCSRGGDDASRGQEVGHVGTFMEVLAVRGGWGTCLVQPGGGGLEGQVQARTGKACRAKKPVLTLWVTGSRRRRWRVSVTSSSSDQGGRRPSPGSEEAGSVHSSPTHPPVPATSVPDTEPGKRTHGAGAQVTVATMAHPF